MDSATGGHTTPGEPVSELERQVMPGASAPVTAQPATSGKPPAATRRHVKSGEPTLVPWVKRNSLAFGIGLVSIIGAMLVVFYYPLVVDGRHVWLLSGPSDIWTQWRAAGLIPNGGGYAQVFSYDILLKTPPGWELLISPIAHRFLGWPFPYVPGGFSIGRPQAFWVAGPTELAAVPFCMCAVDVWLRRLGVSRWRRVATLTTLAVVLPSASLWGHPEDLMALGCALLSLRAVRDDRWSAGWWMSAALAFQVEAVLVLPLCLAMRNRRRVAYVAESVVLPLAVLAVPLIKAPHTTIDALVHQTIFPGGVRFTPLHALNGNSASLDDVLTLLVGLIVAAWVWRRRSSVTDETAFWLVGALYSLRLFYPSLFPYYLVPAMAIFCAVSALRAPSRFAGTLVLGAVMTWWLEFVPLEGRWLWWMSFAAPIVVMAGLSLPRQRVSAASPPAEAFGAADPAKSALTSTAV